MAKMGKTAKQVGSKTGASTSKKGDAAAAAAPDTAAAGDLEARCREGLRAAAAEAEEAMWGAACTAAAEYARNTGHADITAAPAPGDGSQRGSDSEGESGSDGEGDRNSPGGGGGSGKRRNTSTLISVQGDGAGEVLELSDCEEDKKAAKKSGGRPSRARGAPKLWRNLRERALWRADLAASPTLPRVSYCAVLFALCAGELLETLEARQRRAEQRRSSRIPLNPTPKPAAAKKVVEPQPGATLGPRKRGRNNYAFATW